MGYLNTFIIKRASDISPNALARLQAQAAALGLTDPNKVNSYVHQQHQLRNRLNKALPSGINETRRQLMTVHGMTEERANRIIRRIVARRSPGQSAQDIDPRGVANHARRQAFFNPDSIRNGESLNSKNVKQLGSARAEYARRLAARNAAPVAPNPAAPAAPAAPAPADAPVSAKPAPAAAPASPAPAATPAPADSPVSPKPAPAAAPAPATPAPADAPVSAKPAPADAPVSPKPTATAAAAGSADDAAKAAWKSKGGPISYGRRLQATARSTMRSPLRAGKNSWRLAKTFARRNPRLAMLGLIGSSLAGGAMLGNAAASGRPPIRQSNAMNPYAGFETY